ncbi:toxin-antitoxin system HicB family antitoxin [Georgenia yuyongxinii]|uniref:Toxin-antitoxin system HicB family antitoxin n=1 Tax=Georgenia yuyongxinii TaxID=2589797 RepID=A0A5B8C2D1_9MICO|nr:toxin-antitoxin system HicB family antitoxin [Georgenia yuyongxinii]QDC23422.1 toxin-antitoxin system HicB family antitoxin [Georgenia yuyongxinii]
MDVTPYVEALRRDLLTAAEAGGEEARAAADRLLLSLDPAVRLALMDALTQAAAEITSKMPAGAVEVRLRGREPEFVVEVPPPTPSHPGPEAAMDAEDEDGDDAVARITLRIPESLKTRVEELAAKSGRSLNSWIVGALRTASRERVIDVDLSGLADLGQMWRGNNPPRGRRMSGWV